MCGIFGYKGKTKQAHKILIHGLEKLEYRGYDSAGIYVANYQNEHKLIKSIGKVSNLVNKIVEQITENEYYDYGIAHTRWATHGGITLENTHPHTDTANQIYLVHNGIIENYLTLKQQLISQGYTFYSQTDTEVIVKLIEAHWKGDLLQTVEEILPMLDGAYALLIVSNNNPGEIIGVKYGSPLIFGYTEQGEFFFSSDILALSGYVDNIIYLDDGNLVYLKNNDYLLKSEGKLIIKPIEKINVQNIQAEKGEYKHYMLKEIMEQPNIIKEACRGRVNFQDCTLVSSGFIDLEKINIQKILFIAAGTSAHAGMLGSLRFLELARMDAGVEIASEFEYKNIIIDEKTLYVLISQSGETADTIQALKLIEAKKGNTYGIVNVVGSTIARLTKMGMFTRSGMEIGVASSKTFLGQLTVILLLVLYFAQKNGASHIKIQKIIKDLNTLPILLENLLDQTQNIKKIAEQLTKYHNFFFIGRHYQLPIAHEASLKLKEISYLHSEALAAGEFKHGPLALIDENIPTIILSSSGHSWEKNLSTMQEIKARKGKVLFISEENVSGADWFIKIPKISLELTPFLTTVIGQLLAYYVADALGRDIDKPRNLAKSVTVK